ncbi:MAG: hypothetical protein WDZ83_15590 [Rhizobiaceae bacterium]
MFTKTLATALVSGLLLTGAMGSQSFANMGGGGNGNGDGGQAGWASSRNPDGTQITSRSNGDGTRTVTTRDRNGKIIKQKVVGKKKGKKAKKVVRRKSRPWASAYDPNTGTRTTAIGNGDGSRTVIILGPFGIGIGISR